MTILNFAILSFGILCLALSLLVLRICLLKSLTINYNKNKFPFKYKPFGGLKQEAKQ